jgi:hypothetical protein
MGTRAKQPSQTGQAGTGTVTFLPNGPTVSVPDTPDDERAALAAHPHLQQALAASRERRARGERGTSIEEYMARHGIDPAPDAGARERRPTDRRPAGGSGRVSLRLPTDLHGELIAQAERQGVSLNTLLVAYLAREAGVEAAKLAS